PTRVRVTIADAIVVADAGRVDSTVVAEAELSPPSAPAAGRTAGDEYRGPLAYRQGKPLRPDVAQAFDRMEAAARADGVTLVVVSGCAAACGAAARRWNVSATLLAAQAHRESGFNPFARSRAGALGIAQFMPATARSLGLRDPLDPDAAIDAQAHLMRDLLRR